MRDCRREREREKREERERVCVYVCVFVYVRVCVGDTDVESSQTLQSHTPAAHPDRALLERAVLMLRDVARIVNHSVGR